MNENQAHEERTCELCGRVARAYAPPFCNCGGRFLVVATDEDGEAWASSPAHRREIG